VRCTVRDRAPQPAPFPSRLALFPYGVVVEERPGHLPHERAQLESLVEIYRTALAELRSWQLPQSARLIVTLESLLTSATRELRYERASAHAARILRLPRPKPHG
jgi:hypothetical protein